jgi:RNA polymerase sigma-70 factor, ECF subfamily
MSPDYPIQPAIDSRGKALVFRMGPRPDPREHENQTPERVAGLLAAAARGDDAAWTEIIGLYGRRVYALAQTRFRRPDLAEEITQSVFATVATKLGDSYTEKGRFESWLFRITMNRVRDELRRERRQAEVRDPATFRQVAAEDVAAAEPEQLTALRGALAKLPTADREIIELRHHGGLSFRQLVDVLEEPLGTLLARHHRALRKLKQLMEAGPGEESDEDKTRPGGRSRAGSSQ